MSTEEGSPKADDLREQALVALTAVEYTQENDEQRGIDGMDMLFKAYSREDVNEGAMLALTVLLAYEAEAMDVPLSSRVEFVRKLIREGFVFEDDDLDEAGGAQ